jgi:hypothetical protein
MEGGKLAEKAFKNSSYHYLTISFSLSQELGYCYDLRDGTLRNL